MRKVNSGSSISLVMVRRLLVSLILTAISMTTVIGQSSEKRIGWALKPEPTEVSRTAGQRPIVDESILASESNPNPKPNDLTGSWLFTVTPEGPVPTFKALGTFNADGGLVITAQGDVTQFGVTTASHGAWRKTGDRRYSVTFRQIAYDFQGNFTGTLKVRSNVTLNHSSDKFSLVFQAEIFDPSGALIFSFGGVAQATRIKVEPLP